MSGHIITVAQQKGGSGKTTVVVNLAIALLSKGKKVALLDTDPQGSLGKWFMMRENKLGENPNLHFSTATPWGISYELRSRTKAADYVFVDTPPKADSDLRPALREADLVLVPMSASHVDLWATQDVLDLADRVGKTGHIVMNRTRAGTRLGSEVTEAIAKQGATTLKSNLGNRVIYAETLGRGLGVVEAGNNMLAVSEVMSLADEITAIL
ncbi:ParA family partition ATPase [Marimonas lutisalis]|uniref:ParA family partition ATPase n=1 Tax=Marimonas lutisalis TaxID=2545756 RepID=UPI0010F75FDB|nr:ParA family partition ATPase [Marimonas lutisalis]